MIIYIKPIKQITMFYKVFNILRIEKENQKNIIYIPVNNKTKKKKTKKVCEKLCKYLYNNNIKNIVLEKELMKNETAKNVLYSSNINILDGTKISKFLIYNVIQRVYEYKKKNIELGEITLLINDNDDINTQTIINLAKKAKRMNIVTNNIKRFRKIVDNLYNELGILIKLSNNIKTNLKSSDIIVNIDFSEDILNKLDIPNDAIVINIPENTKIKSKKFSGIYIEKWETKIPLKYKLEEFEEIITYEACIYEKTVNEIFKQIEKDEIKIGRLIGINGVINSKEFIKE